MIPRVKLDEVLPYKASKWLTLPLLVTPEEMKEVLSLLPKWIAPLSGVISEKDEILSKELFLSLYEPYYSQIVQGIKRPEIDSRLTAASFSDLDEMQVVVIQGGLLMRIKKPVIEIKPYKLHYSKTSGKFVDTTHSQESFAFGLVFSIPQIYQNPLTHDIEKVELPAFKELQKWSRAQTIPAPFQVEGRTLNIPARISKFLPKSILDLDKRTNL